MLDHFSHSELACPTTDQVRLAPGFGEALEQLRLKLDAPIYLTSACRSPGHNTKVRGHPRSLHLTINEHHTTGGTCAVDTVATDGQYRAKLITLSMVSVDLPTPGAADVKVTWPRINRHVLIRQGSSNYENMREMDRNPVMRYHPN